MASREEQDRIEALLLMGEYSAYQGYEDIFLCVQARIRKCKFEVEERHPYYLQTLFVHLLKVLKDVTYTNSETFEILLREFDMVMGIVKLRQLVCNDCGDLAQISEDDIVESVGFQHSTYIKSIEEIFSNNGMNQQKENSDNFDSLTNIFTEVNMSKKSKKKQLSKKLVCELLNDESLAAFKGDLVAYIREVRKTACRIPMIKGPDDGERRAQEMRRDGKADWTNEQRSNAGFPQDPSMVLLGGKSAGKGSSSAAASGSSSKSRKVDELPAAASSGDGDATFSPNGGGMDDSVKQSKTSPVASKAITAPSTKRSDFKPGDLAKKTAFFNRTVKDQDPLKEINDEANYEDDYRDTTKVPKKDSKINKKKDKTSSSSSSSLTATKGQTRAAAAITASAQEDATDDMDYGGNEILTQAQMPEDDIIEETKQQHRRRQQTSVTKASGGRASGAKRARSPTKSSSSSSSSSAAGDADDEDIDDDDEDFQHNNTDKRFEIAKKMKLDHGGSDGEKVGGSDGEKVGWDRDQDEMVPTSENTASNKDSMKNKFVAAKGSGAAGAGAGYVLPAFGRKAPAPAVGTNKRRWSDDEKETFLAAIRAHGVGNWQSMLDDPRFISQLDGRTGVNLKDKYRTMLKNGEA